MIAKVRRPDTRSLRQSSIECRMNYSQPKTRQGRGAGSPLRTLVFAAAWTLAMRGYSATTSNTFSSSLSSPSLPDAGPSLLRVLGALALVLGLFLGGAWLVRNGRFTTLGRSRSARLNLLETRSLGARQAIYVVAYGQERFLIGSTPAGINLLSHLAPPQENENGLPEQPPANLSFSQAFAQVLSGQKSTPTKPGGAT